MKDKIILSTGILGLYLISFYILYEAYLDKFEYIYEASFFMIIGLTILCIPLFILVSEES